MAPDRRRSDDPEGFDGRDFRHESREEIRLGYHGTTFSATGLGVYLAIAFALLITSNIYAGLRIENAILAARKADLEEHLNLARAEDRTACGVLMSPEDRIKFRQDYAPGAFEKWCPWMDEGKK